MSEKAAYYTSQQAEVVEYLSKYFDTATVQRLIARYDLRTLNHIDISINDNEMQFMLSRQMITSYEANTLRMLIRMRKMNDLLQELNKTY
jgi:hypothetical protein